MSFLFYLSLHPLDNLRFVLYSSCIICPQYILNRFVAFKILIIEEETVDIWY